MKKTNMRLMLVALLVMASSVSAQETRLIERGRSITATLESGHGTITRSISAPKYSCTARSIRSPWTWSSPSWGRMGNRSVLSTKSRTGKWPLPGQGESVLQI